MRRVLSCVLVLFSVQGIAENPRIPPADFAGIVHRCAPRAAVSTMLAIARTESSLHPYSISTNYPQKLAHMSGYDHARIDLARQPASKAEAIRWAAWFRQHKVTVSIGVMQVNNQVAARYGVTDEELMEPCTNVSVAAQILADYYSSASVMYPQPQQALRAAISAYNTGSLSAGFSNGYVSQVYRNGR